jgi:hypothetical protein
MIAVLTKTATLPNTITFYAVTNTTLTIDRVLSVNFFLYSNIIYCIKA